ncbi:exonuclease SbcCD subunit D [Aerococcus agrisoli]|uniref:Nuclease SbcCD subunit D n=1 Tax=Aerococcus agrisoli TaxID=2487350 RepID=A0A3N4H285_9LACT|nr:exonuclease SbcCD subunit D [Aerococcus agrisoli]RPA65481.1 exonuclease SbcCD subunit D [Aerococcus agrisoli]
MKIIHTADWHIGKIVNEHPLIEDQAAILEDWLNQTIALAPDLVIMAGDLYDRTLPSRDAVQLANQLLTRMTRELNCPICIISGNHDAGERVAYANDILANQGLYMIGLPTQEIAKVSTEEADIYLLPFSDHLTLKRIYPDETIHSIEDATRVQVKAIKEQWDQSRLNIVLYHGYVTASSMANPGEDLEKSKSERPLSIGTSEYVPTNVFEGFDYVALGHLHGSQKVGSERIRYSGSPLKFSKSEVNHHKGFLEIDLDKANDSIEVTKHELVPKIDMRVIRGEFEDLLAGSSDDYIFFELTDEFTQHEAMNRLKQRYPNAMSLEYTALKNEQSINHTAERKVFQEKPVWDQFGDFYEANTAKELSEYQTTIVQDVFKEILKED